MEIRFAEPRDVAGILALLRQVGKVHHELRPDLFRKGAQKYGASQILTMLNSSKTLIFVAIQDDAVAGYGFCQVKLYDCDPVMMDRTEIYIDDICVDEKCRGTGVGTAIYHEIVRYARMRRAHSITLNVWAGNEKAMAFYEKLGMKPQKIGMELPL